MTTDGPSDAAGPPEGPPEGVGPLAKELLAGPWRPLPMALRLAHACGLILPNPAMLTLAHRVVARWSQPPSAAELIDYVNAQRIDPATVLSSPPRGRPPAPKVPTQARFHHPMFARPLTSRADLLRLLDLTSAELDWFADVQSRNGRIPTGPLQHYRYRSATHHGRTRLLEIPKPRLKEIQRRIARHVINAIGLHPAAHGAVRGRSVRTALEPHAGSFVIVKCDLESFFASITASRVKATFTLLDMDAELCSLLSGLCTNTVPSRVRRELPQPEGTDVQAAHWRSLRRLAEPHLPQGAATSSGLANVIGYGLDHRLSRLAQTLGARYTRYVDDLIFSGPRSLSVGVLLDATRQIVHDEGFAMAERKTAVLRESHRQGALGTVLNARPTISRPEYDRLRAILHNCAVHGPASQARGESVIEFHARLQGKLAWLGSIDPVRGERLSAQFNALLWPLPL